MYLFQSIITLKEKRVNFLCSVVFFPKSCSIAGLLRYNYITRQFGEAIILFYYCYHNLSSNPFRMENFV